MEVTYHMVKTCGENFRANLENWNMEENRKRARPKTEKNQDRNQDGEMRCDANVREGEMGSGEKAQHR